MHLALSAPAHHLAELHTTQGDFGVGQSLDKSWTNLPVRSRCSARVKRRNLFRSRGQTRSQNRLAGSTFDLSNKRSIPVVTVLFLMKAPLEASRETLQNALDDLSSPRSSSEVKTRALETLERLLAFACVSKDSSEDLHNFTALQYTFECNVPLRLLAWINMSTLTLEVLTNKGTMDHEQETQASKLSSQLSLSLSLIQGAALNHVVSKNFLGRKYALEVLLDLLLASRHLSSIPPVLPTRTKSSSSNRGQESAPQSLSSIVLDTLLCILVDSPSALRSFEESNGVQAVVKILKRAGTPREVRSVDQ